MRNQESAKVGIRGVAFDRGVSTGFEIQVVTTAFGFITVPIAIGEVVTGNGMRSTVEQNSCQILNPRHELIKIAR
jgi:hypothetical protein